jgi:hypothetical protein
MTAQEENRKNGKFNNKAAKATKVETQYQKDVDVSGVATAVASKARILFAPQAFGQVEFQAFCFKEPSLWPLRPCC